MIRVLLVDDHPVVREGLRAYLAIHEDIDVVGEASSVDEAIAVADEHGPEVVLLDLELAGSHGLSAIPRLLDRQPPPRVVVLTSFLDEDWVRQAVRLGAAGYLVKNAGPTTILEGIRAAARGETPMDPSAVRTLASAREEPIDALTPREHEVLMLIARGMSNRAIAEELVVTEKTVKTHVSAVLRKLDVDDRTQAALYARDRGL